MDKFIRIICEDLNIPIPRISNDTSVFCTDTQLAACSSDGNTIYLPKTDTLTPELMLAIAHELRHVYQIKYFPDKYFKTYSPNHSISTEEYNLQEAEIDANAYASVIISCLIGIKPLFQNMSKNVRDAISKRAKEISNQN